MQLTAAVSILLILACAACAGTPSPEGPEPEEITDEDLSEHGKLLDATLLATVTRAELQGLVPAPIVVDNGYAVFSMTYRTHGADATATVTLPDGEAPGEGFPVVANAHGTIGLDDPCALSGTISGAGLAGLFGARGAIGVAPDYVGLGGPGLHPYLHAESEARAVLDAIRAARALAEREGLAASTRVAVVGLSQGGHAALATAALHSSYAPDLDLRAIGAAAPASGFREDWHGIELEGAHQIYFAMIAYVFAKEAGLSAGDVFTPTLAADADTLFTTRCAWSPRFDADEPLLSDALPTEPTALYRDDVLDAFNGETELAWVDEGFARSRLAAIPTTAAVRIWQGDADTTVLPAATSNLVDALRAGGVDVELTIVPGGTHLDTAFGFLASLDRARDESIDWVREQLDAQ